MSRYPRRNRSVVRRGESPVAQISAGGGAEPELLGEEDEDQQQLDFNADAGDHFDALVDAPTVIRIPRSVVNSSSSLLNSTNKGIEHLEKWSPDDKVKVEDWIKKVEVVKKGWRWNDEQTITAVQVKLSDAHAFNDLSEFIAAAEKENPIVTWATVKSYLISLYKSSIMTTVIRGQLYDCRQNLSINESVTDYTKRFREIAAKLTKINEDEKVDIFLNGLEVGIQEHVMAQLNKAEIRSLAVAAKFATEAEIFKQRKLQQMKSFQQQSQSWY